MIFGFIGNMGSGKTLSMVKEAYSLYNKGFTIYSNIKLNFPHKDYDSSLLEGYATDNKSFYKAVFLLDEAHIFMDSRASLSRRNKVLTAFLTQTRKKDVILIFTTQFIHQIDKRLRHVCDAIIECYGKQFKGEHYVLNRINVFKIEGVLTYNSIFKAKPYYELYDSYEVVKPLFND